MRPPAFRFYVDNFVEGTVSMTDAEVGLYVRMLCLQWSQGYVPNDDTEIMRLSRGSTGVQPDSNRPVLDLARIKRKFEVGIDGNLRNLRMEIERKKAKKFSKSQSEKGLSSARKRQPGLNPGSTGVQPSVSVSGSTGSPLKRIENEIPDFEQAFAMTCTAAIPREFCQMVFDSWETRSGCDAAGVRVDWLKYVVGRWKNEQNEWRKGTHRGQTHDKSKSEPKHAGTDRNAGTYNEGKAHLYRDAVIRPKPKVG